MKHASIAFAVFYTSLLMISSACKKDPPPEEAVLPTNLVTVITTTEGTATVNAAADNANFYTFLFYEGNNVTTIEDNSGVGEYTFSASGTYTLKTRAHATHADYVEKVETITVAIDPGWLGGVPHIDSGYATPTSYAGMTLVWQDEFNGTSLSSDWVHEIGNGNWGWGNNELEYYRPENTTVEGGLLKITAKSESFGGFSYTSSRVKTQGIQRFQYGRIDIRAALPYGQGYWPALWMLGENITTASWPNCGEIDIMEMVGGTTAAGAGNNKVHGTIHWEQNGHASYGGTSTIPQWYAEEFHVFSIVWDTNTIKWYRDDVLYHTADITPSNLAAFHQEFFFIFNVAIGGTWPGSPDPSTVFPQTMAVDYVRVFQ